METPELKNRIVISKKNSNTSKKLLDTLNSISNEDINNVGDAIIEKMNQPVHDLDWAKRVIYDEDESIEHYENYREALDILANSGDSFLFMEF